MNRDVMFSSATDQWETPQPLFDKLDQVYHFETDVCALPENAKCKHYFTPELDGLKQEWKGRCWMNPPYGRQIGEWVRKAFESGGGVHWLFVCFLPELIRHGSMIIFCPMPRLNSSGGG